MTIVNGRAHPTRKIVSSCVMMLARTWLHVSILPCVSIVVWRCRFPSTDACDTLDSNRGAPGPSSGNDDSNATSLIRLVAPAADGAEAERRLAAASAASSLRLLSHSVTALHCDFSARSILTCME